MKNFFRTFLKEENGASAAEYALILAIVGAAIAFAAFSLGESINTAITDAKDCIDAPPETADGECGTA